MHHDERQREVAALTEERDCLTRELDEERLADIEVQEIIGRYAADNVRLARDLADAITECQRLCGDDEKVCDILERVDPTLLDYDETPGCVEALAKRLAGERDTVKILATSTRALLTRAEDAESKLAERDGVIETLQFQNAELDFEAGGVLSSLAYQKRELAEARAALQGAKDNLDANDELRAWAILRTALAPSDQKGDRQS
jgi:chromosome segregation ATPase